MPRAYRVKPTCHPDRPHVARGLCSKCYTILWRERDKFEKAAPRVETPVFDERQVIPTRSSTLRQFAVTEFPIDACPKCSSSTFQYYGRQALCYICGQDVWLVRDGVPV